MKKLIILVVTFIILAIGTTSIMIKITNGNKNVNEVTYEEKNANNETEEESLEKTINLKGTYSQNDLLILESDYYLEDYDKNIKIPQISGLKNKNIENKINDNIKSKISNKIGEILQKEAVTECSCHFYNNLQSNFSNVLSFGLYVHTDLYSEYIGLNYNLVDGEELMFEDLFKKDENLKPILRIALYRMLVQEQNEESLGEGEYTLSSPYYNTDDETWYVEKIWGDEEGEHKETIEYSVPISEYEIEKYAEKFLNSKEKVFFFTPARLYIIINGYEYTLYFKDIADKVVIYDKYLTNESLFEENNIGAKNFIACSEEINLGKYKETKYESENFFYDRNISVLGENTSDKFLNSKIESQIQETNNIIDEYRKTAKKNQDKAYFLFVEPELSEASSWYSIYNTEKNKHWNLFITDMKTKVIICDIEEKESVLEKILTVYRYYNLCFYGNIINSINEGYIVGGEYLDKPVSETSEKKYYDILTGYEIASVKDIFKDDIDYISVIRNNANDNKIDNNTRFELKSSGITAFTDKENDQYVNVSYSDIEQYLKLKEIKPEILPSSTRQIERAEIENMDKDELYRAYNEIFARHGHDFQTPEYKYYFSLWDWYEPINGKTVTVDELSEIEKYNYSLIKSVIDERY